jgi:peptidyl-prolyl cis-trans isomerase SurA
VPVLKAKLQNMPQYQFELDKFIARLNDKLSVKHYTEYYPQLKQRLAVFAANAPFLYRDTIQPKLMLQIGDKKYNENDFGKYIQENFYTVFPKPGMDKYDALLKNAVQSFVLDYYKDDIRANNSEYKALMNEYRNGIMIFSLSEKYVWNKASDDSAGLLAYYNQHKSDFMLKKHATLRTVYADNLRQANSIYKYLSKDKMVSDDALSEKMKTLGVAEPGITSQTIEEGKSKVSLSAEALEKPKEDGQKYVITQVYNILPEKQRAFEECRGYVVAAYQEQLEKKWLDELRQKYPVVVNNDVFESMVKTN